jgi:hypothetical protein
VFGNCQKYIQRRVFEDDAIEQTGLPVLHAGEALAAEQRAWVEGADMFFIATAHPERGADVSHRGGFPGFVQATGPTTIVFPDYAGNNMFQTLGNISTQPEAGLLFVDFEAGRTLHLTGRAEVLWDEAARPYAPDTGRAVRFEIGAVRELTVRAIPHAELVEYSPANPPIVHPAPAGG